MRVLKRMIFGGEDDLISDSSEDCAAQRLLGTGCNRPPQSSQCEYKHRRAPAYV